MTKPIEGWVAQAVHRPDIVSHVFETAEEASEVYQITEKTSQWRLRPVRITFTDEQEEKSHLPPNITSISEFNAMPDADKEAYFDSAFGPYPGAPSQAGARLTAGDSGGKFFKRSWEGTADEIRKERERIWSVFMDSDFFWCASGEMEPQVFKRELGDFKKAIFGEEK